MPYEDVHKQPKGPGDARPTANQIIQDQDLVNKLVGKTVLITGGTSGLGYETAKAILATGATVFITARTAEKGEHAAASLNTSSDGPKVQVVEMALDSFDSIKSGAADFLQRSSALNVLVCNAGVMACPESRTSDGFETQFAVNHLSHFLLFHLLQDIMSKSTSSEFPSRVVSLSSSGHRNSGLLLGDYNFDKTPYDPWQAYGQSKTANIYFANQIEKRFGERGLHATSLHPGCIHTSLERHISDNEFAQAFINTASAQHLWKTPEQGAATTVWAAVGTGWKGGRYLEDVNEARAFDPEDPLGMHANGYAEHAYDTASATQLWEDSLAIIAEKAGVRAE